MAVVLAVVADGDKGGGGRDLSDVGVVGKGGGEGGRKGDGQGGCKGGGRGVLIFN